MKTYPLKLRTRHSTHFPLRGAFRFPFRSVIRFGSTTPLENIYPKSVLSTNPTIIEINTPEAVANSANKLLMKQRFTEAGIKTADWWTWEEEDKFRYNGELISVEEMFTKFPKGFVMKNIYGSRGTGTFLIRTLKDWEDFKNG